MPYLQSCLFTEVVLLREKQVWARTLTFRVVISQCTDSSGTSALKQSKVVHRENCFCDLTLSVHYNIEYYLLRSSSVQFTTPPTKYYAHVKKVKNLKKGKVRLHSVTIAAHAALAALSSQTKPAYRLRCRPSPRSRTLAYSHTLSF